MQANPDAHSAEVTQRAIFPVDLGGSITVVVISVKVPSLLRVLLLVVIPEGSTKFQVLDQGITDRRRLTSVPTRDSKYCT